MIQCVEEFAALFDRASGRDTGFEILRKITTQLGFPYIIYAPVRSHPMADRNWAVTNFPSAWQKLYVEKNYIQKDPVRNHVIITSRPFTWSSLERTLPEDERVIFADFRACGVADAVVVPSHGPWGRVIATGFATHTTSAITPAALDILQILATRFDHTYCDDNYVTDIHLTDREREILTKVSMGYGGYQIAKILDLSSNSIEWHMKNIFVKLCVRSRTAAVVKAVQLGLIQI